MWSMQLRAVLFFAYPFCVVAMEFEQKTPGTPKNIPCIEASTLEHECIEVRDLEDDDAEYAEISDNRKSNNCSEGRSSIDMPSEHPIHDTYYNSNMSPRRLSKIDVETRVPSTPLCVTMSAPAPNILPTPACRDEELIDARGAVELMVRGNQLHDLMEAEIIPSVTTPSDPEEMGKVNQQVMSSSLQEQHADHVALPIPVPAHSMQRSAPLELSKESPILHLPKKPAYDCCHKCMLSCCVCFTRLGKWIARGKSAMRKDLGQIEKD